MIRAAIAGGAGYTAGELIRILLNHSQVDLRYVQSESHDSEPLGAVHGDLLWCDKHFGAIDFSDTDVLFMCMGHGKSRGYLAAHDIPEKVRIIDLGNDFRLKDESEGFVYGLPELSREEIKAARHIANPGCFATSIELGLLPLAAAGILPETIDTVAITGSTGAGQKPTESTHFSNRSANLSNYKVFTHQHMGEIMETLGKAGAKAGTDLAFVPVRGCHTRGILANSVMRLEGKSLGELTELYKSFYAAYPFVQVSDVPVYMKQVINTNYCFISLEMQEDKLLVTSVIDNLLKGASGQAVENMNLMFSLPEDCGLHLKANYF